MTKIQNNFTLGIIDKDNDSRLTQDGTLIDAENFLVTTTEGSNRGVGKNVPGNVKKTSYNISGGKTMGVGKNPSKNKVYNFIKGTNYDYIIEYDVETNTSVTVAQATTGGALNFIAGERILNVDIVSSGEEDGDLIFWSGDSNPPRCGNIARMKTWSIDGFSEDEISVIKIPPVFSPTLTPSISAENAESNYLDRRFLSFCYRYKYNDGYYSAISSWSEYFFIPASYNLDYETFENLGMLNQNNACDITFNTGPRDVIGIDIIFKASNSSIPFIVEKLIKSEEGWANNSNQTIQFNNSKVYQALPESEYFHSFDNVPISAKAQTMIGNRVAYANYKEGHDLIDIDGNKVVMDYTLELVQSDLFGEVLEVEPVSIGYTFDAIPITLPEGQIDMDFTGIDLIQGASISVSFNIKSAPLLTEFTRDFIYILTDDYTDLTDLILNSTIVNEVGVNLTNYFESNGGIIFPPDYVPDYELLKGFEVTNTGNILSFNFPAVKFEIDETPDPNTFIYDYYSDNNSTAFFQNIAIGRSMKSLRSYEICKIYKDHQGRKSTALTSENNTLFIPNAASITQNQIKVIIPPTQKPPVWAETYKFGIKFNKGHYETIPINIFFVDGIYRWIKLDGENRNKTKEGDILIVKADEQGPLGNVVRVKVLEWGFKEENFLTTNATSIVEPAGIYAKIKASNFQMQYKANEFVLYEQKSATKNDRPFSFLGDFSTLDDEGNKIDRPINQGAVLALYFSSNYNNTPPFVNFNRSYTAQSDYDNFEDFFDAQIEPLGFESTTHPDKTYNVQLVRGNPVYGFPLEPDTITDITPDPAGFLWLVIEGTEAGNGTRRGFLDASLTLRFVSGLYVFETEALDDGNDIYFETPETFTITDGEHDVLEPVLTRTFNCFCQGNGVESFQIRDAFNEKELAIDFCPTAVSEDEYKQVNRFADITYSGVFNSNTNVNKLNEFNLSLANFKDDIEKSYGPIIKIKGQDTNLEVYQEDKVSQVFYGKDLLYNADGTTNLSRIESVLGQQKTDGGEYGISYHPDSHDDYAFNSYLTDTKRGVVLKRNYNNGLFEISFQGMRSYFKKLFRENTINHINGKYDQFHDYYLLNIQYNDTEYVTWVYSDKDNGWLGRLRMNPEDMIRINNHFIAFKDGEIYLCNQTDAYNTFFGIEYPSTFAFNFNKDVSFRKNFENISIEGTVPLDIILKTDLDNGYINKEDFEKKEGIFYAYGRHSNEGFDTSKLSFQGLGQPSISGNYLNFGFDLDSVASVGDEILNLSGELVGTILSKTTQSLVLNTVNNIVSGDFVLAAKPQSIANQSLLGYYMKTSCEFSSTQPQEIFAVNTEVSRSFE